MQHNDVILYFILKTQCPEVALSSWHAHNNTKEEKQERFTVGKKL